MTTTAHEDQYLAAPEPVRQPYDTAAILRRNVAALELALKQQTDRAEAAEAELLAVREDNHSMMTEIHEMRTELAKMREQKPVGQVQESSPSDKWPVMRTLGEFPPIGTYLYAAPIPAPAPSVPQEWREVMAELAADLQSACDAEHPHRDQYPSVMRKYNNDMEIVEKARALLQSDEVRHD